MSFSRASHELLVSFAHLLEVDFSLPVSGCSMHGMMTGEVVAATSSASFKLIFICVAVGWLLKTSRLPKETAPVLTQVQYTQTISS